MTKEEALARVREWYHEETAKLSTAQVRDGLHHLRVLKRIFSDQEVKSSLEPSVKEWCLEHPQTDEERAATDKLEKRAAEYSAPAIKLLVTTRDKNTSVIEIQAPVSISGAEDPNRAMWVMHDAGGTDYWFNKDDGTYDGWEITLPWNPEVMNQIEKIMKEHLEK